MCFGNYSVEKNFTLYYKTTVYKRSFLEVVSNMTKKKVKSWADGDSGVFSDGSRFRLRNVRAPEYPSKKGKQAKKSATGMTGRSRGWVGIKSYAKDKYGRTVVDMWNKDGSINKRLRKKGYTNKGR